MRGLVNDAVEIEGSSPSALLNAPTTMSSYSSCQIFGTGKKDKYEAKISELERRPGSSDAANKVPGSLLALTCLRLFSFYINITDYKSRSIQPHSIQSANSEPNS